MSVVSERQLRREWSLDELSQLISAGVKAGVGRCRSRQIKEQPPDAYQPPKLNQLPFASTRIPRDLCITMYEQIATEGLTLGDAAAIWEYPIEVLRREFADLEREMAEDALKRTTPGRKVYRG